MQSELKSLSRIFSETIFRIPDYQRGYSWQLKHLKDFWSDIEQLSLGQSHYTGVLTLEPARPSDYQRWDDDIWIIESKRYSSLYIVDGQQRLTTAVILVQAIIERIQDDEMLNYTTKADIRRKYIFESKDGGISRSYIFGYEKDNPSYEFLKKSIFGESSINHSVDESTVYTANLLSAKDFFSQRLRDLSLIKVEEIFTKLTQHLQFNIFYIEPELDVFVTFETMNNRGKPLSHLELLKNRLIYLSTKFDTEKTEREHLRRAINESWMTVYHYLGKAATRRLTDDVFLRAHFLCYFGPTLPKKDVEEGDDERYLVASYVRRDEKYKDYLLEEVFTARRVVDTHKNKLSVHDIYSYAKDIKNAVKSYYEVTTPESSPWPDEQKILLSRINRLGFFDIFFFSVALMRKIKDAEGRERALLAAERAGFLYRMRPYFFSSNGFDMEQDALRLLGGDRSPEEIARQLNALSDRFAASTDFTDALRGIGKNNGYYSWGAIRYFMYEYEQHLRKLSKTTRQLLHWEAYKAEGFDSDHKTIEHIYPQRATDPYWKTQFSEFSVIERNTLRNSLGNLLPASNGKNASLSNKSFEAKKGSTTNQVGYRYGCLSEIQVAHEQDWGAKEILRRGVALLSFMEERWSVALGDDAKKVELLGLTFVPKRLGIALDRLLSNPLPIPKLDSTVEESLVKRRAP